MAAVTPPLPVNVADPPDDPEPTVNVSVTTVPENVIIPGATSVVKLLIT